MKRKIIKIYNKRNKKLIFKWNSQTKNQKIKKKVGELQGKLKEFIIIFMIFLQKELIQNSFQ